MTAGLLFAQAALLPSSVATPEAMAEWYDTVHLKDVCAVEGGPKFALRYTNTNPDAKWKSLALYPLNDINVVKSEAIKAIPNEWDGWEGKGAGKDATPKKMWEVMEFDTRVYELIQVFEGQVPKEGARGTCVVTVGMEPAEGTDEEFEDWYRKQHLDMLSMVTGYRRTTRYKLTDFGFIPRPEGLPTYLAIHEWDSRNFSQDLLRLVVGTEWSKIVIHGAKTFDRNAWTLAFTEGPKNVKIHGEK